jgi:outer membrane biosynthesis protein TonB
VLLHGALIAVFLFAHASTPPSPPPPYMVHLLAAPAGERAVGVVQPAPPKVTKPVAPTPAPAKPTAVKPRPAPPKAKPKSAPKAPSEAAPATKASEPPAPPAPAGGGPTGGRGNDVANIDTPGIEFDYPFYINGIARAIITRFSAPPNSQLIAEVRFVIKRDGSVDPESIRIVTSSRNYSFDQRALGAVEAAANAHAFGPLPQTFREDILPVTFRFSPTSYR